MDLSDNDSDCGSEYDMCPMRSNSYALPFDLTALENVILMISDNFDFRVVLRDGRAQSALLMTTGLTLAGGLIGRHYGGKIGAMVGGAVGGACGLGIVAVSMREIWEDIKEKLSELFELVYDYLAAMGLEDYKKLEVFLTQHSGSHAQLAMIILESVSNVLERFNYAVLKSLISNGWQHMPDTYKQMEYNKVKQRTSVQKRKRGHLSEFYDPQKNTSNQSWLHKYREKL